MGIAGVVFALMGGFVYVGAKSEIHEIEAFLLFLIAAVFFVGSNIVKAIEARRRPVVALPIAESAPKPKQEPWPNA